MLNRHTCLAFTWDGARHCCGVRLRRAATRFHVVSVWDATPRDEQSIGECLMEGFHALGGDDNCTVVAGPAEWPGGCLDVKLPCLGYAEEVRAVEFELKRQAPVDPDSLVWGFRVLRHKGADGLATVRLAFMRAENWRQITNELSLLKPGVDIILSPCVALDPALAGCGFADESGAIFQPVAAEGVAREWVDEAACGKPLFGLGDAPLASAHLTIESKLRNLPAERQREYTGAIVLAMHGLTRTSMDARTWLPVPAEICVRRHRGPRLTAFALGAYAAACLALILAVQGVRNFRSLRALKTECATLQKRVKETTVNTDERIFLDKLKEEFKLASTSRPVLTDCLADLTDRLIDESWVQSFTWNDGRVEVELSSIDPDLDVVKIFTSSTIFSDVVPVRKRVEADGAISIRVQMQAVTGNRAPVTPEREMP